MNPHNPNAAPIYSSPPRFRLPPRYSPRVQVVITLIIFAPLVLWALWG